MHCYINCLINHIKCLLGHGERHKIQRSCCSTFVPLLQAGIFLSKTWCCGLNERHTLRFPINVWKHMTGITLGTLEWLKYTFWKKWLVCWIVLLHWAGEVSAAFLCSVVFCTPPSHNPWLWPIFLYDFANYLWHFNKCPFFNFRKCWLVIISHTSVADLPVWFHYTNA